MPQPYVCLRFHSPTLPLPPLSPPLTPSQGRGELSIYHDLPGLATAALAADVA
jgi:hypothetical protein